MNELTQVAVETCHGRFETGQPIRFRFMRNAVPAPYLGSKYGQDIEPHGTYLLEDGHGAWQHPVTDPSGRVEWTFGWAEFTCPLVLSFTTASSDSMEPLYGPSGWKARLVDHYELTGAELTAALRADGYDGIVTVWVGYKGPAYTKEIIDLTGGDALELNP
jgi:hypothetical protein